MAIDTQARMQRREGAARVYRQSQGPAARVVSGTGLGLANGLDWIMAPFRNPRMVFAGATSLGLARGAFYGFFAGLVTIALGAQLPMLLILMGVGAIGYGVYDGQKSLDKRITGKSGKPLSEKIAEQSGAVPVQSKAVDRNPGELLRPSAKATFTQREEERRAARGPQQL